MGETIGEGSVKKIVELERVLLQGATADGVPLIDSGLSTIEKSKTVPPDVVPTMGVPLLTAPTNMESAMQKVGAVDAAEKSTSAKTLVPTLNASELTLDMLKGWGESLRAMRERIHEILNSSAYLQFQEFYKREASVPSRAISSVEEKEKPSVEGSPSSEAVAKSEPTWFFTVLLDRLETVERVPPTVAIPEMKASEDPSQALLLPLTAALLSGGILGSERGANASPMIVDPTGSLLEAIGPLQALFPQLSLQDVVPLINLMVMPPIYYRSWEEAVSRTPHERKNYANIVKKFVEDVIKMVAHPEFVQNLLICMHGIERLSPQDRDRLTHMLKLVLIGVALSLLYSVEVGKIQNEQFGGIEPEELRDLLLGRGIEGKDRSKKRGFMEEFSLNLIKRAREQLSLLSPEDRLQAADMLITYVTKKRDFEPMLEPARVFSEVLSLNAPLDVIGVMPV